MASNSRREKRTIGNEEKKYFLSLTPDDITLQLLQDLFADRYDVETKKVIPSRYETYDEMKLKADEYFNKSEIVTNLGLFIFNKFLIEPDFKEYLGYINDPITSKRWKQIESTMAKIILESDGNELVMKYFEFLDRVTWLGFTFHSEICSSRTLSVMKPNPKIQAKKREALKKHKEDIENGDITAVVAMSNELVKFAEKELRDDPAYELYASGARGSFDNSYRQLQIMKGPVWDAANNKWDIMTNSLYEGIPKEQLSTMANAIIDGTYPKSISSGESGYLTKQLNSAFQSNILDEAGTDCGTKALTDVFITDSNKNFYFYHYILDGNKLVRLDDSSINKYINKKVKMRLPGTCIGTKLCSKCAGDRFYMLGIENIGLTTGRVSNSLLRAKMKQAHDATVRVYPVDPNEIIIPFK